MKQRCPWCAMVFVGREVRYVRCRKTDRWYSRWLRAWHLHDAALPTGIAGQDTIGIRWRSSNTADYHHTDTFETEADQ